jgi:Ca2+-binding EF-hand superfamily protein
MKLLYSALLGYALSRGVVDKNGDAPGQPQKLHEKYQEKKLVQDDDIEFQSDEYDHYAMTGKDEYKTFDDLSPEEAREKLSILVDKMDKDKDGQVTEKELTTWIHYVQTKYIYEDTDRQWEENDKNRDGKITWQEYKENTYGFLSAEEMNKEEDDGFSYASMEVRDKRRWDVADKENKGYLTKDDLTAFLHPEEHEHMKSIVIMETIEDIDKDGDGKISVEEYIGDMWLEEEDGEEPEWVSEERKSFHEHRDRDGTGYLEDEEVRDWILPDEYDHAEGEAKHLIESADDDGDGKLSKDEILEHQETFVGSQATDWGDAVVRHDEF